MDFNILNGWLILAATGCGVVLWWLFRSLHSRVERAETAMTDFKLYCANKFVTSESLEKALDNLNDTIKAVFSKLERIDEKLANKADRT
jgi:dipeptidase